MKAKKSFTVMMALMWFVNLQAQDSNNVSLLGHWPDAPSRAVFVDGDHIYLGNGGALDILKLTDSVDLIRVGRFETYSPINDIYKDGEFVFLANRAEGLRIIDVSTPETPIEVARFPGTIYEVFGDSTHVYVMGSGVGGSSMGLSIINMADPATPAIIGFVATSGGDIYVRDGYAYVGGGNFRIIDLSNPSSPSHLVTLPTYAIVSSVHIAGTFAYVTSGADDNPGIEMIDISNPNAPHSVAFYDFDDGYNSYRAHDVFVSGKYAYVVISPDVPWSSGGLRIVDISNPGNLIQVGQRDLRNSYRTVYAAEDNAYVAGDDGLHILTVSDPTSPILKGRYETSGLATGAFVKDNVAYVSQSRGLQMLDISDVSTPEKLATYWTNIWTPAVFVSGEHAFVAAHDSGLIILDISDPQAPKNVGSVVGRHGTRDVHVVDNLAYIGYYDYSGGLQIVDVSDPSSPTELWFQASRWSIRDLHVKDDYIFVADEKTGLRIFDARVPSSAIEVGTFDPGGAGKSVSIQGDLAYLLVSEKLFILDIHDRSAIEEIASLEIPGSPRAVQVDGDFAYVIIWKSGGNGLKVFDVSDSALPKEVGFFDTGGTPYGLQVAEKTIFMADGPVGVWMLRNDLITGIIDESSGPFSFMLEQNHPNPFNGSTVIQFSLEKNANIILSIFNLRGQKIETLVEGERLAGKHTVVWNPTRLPSGVYFYQLQAANSTTTRKLALIR